MDAPIISQTEAKEVPKEAHEPPRVAFLGTLGVLALVTAITLVGLGLYFLTNSYLGCAPSCPSWQIAKFNLQEDYDEALAGLGVVFLIPAIWAFAVRSQCRAASSEGGRPLPARRVRMPYLVFGACVILVAASSVIFSSSIAAVVVPPWYCQSEFPTALSLGMAEVGSGPHATVWYENVSIQDAARGLSIDLLGFNVETRSGEVVPPPTGSNVTVFNLLDIPIAVFAFSSATWSGAGATANVTTSEILSLEWIQTSTSDPLSGDRLDVTLSGCQGQASTDLQ